jgi:hypothetical protein
MNLRLLAEAAKCLFWGHFHVDARDRKVGFGPKNGRRRLDRYFRKVPQTDSCTAAINVRRISSKTPRALRSAVLIFVLTAAFRLMSAFQPCRPGLVVFGVRQRAFGRSAQIVFQTIERSLDGEDVLTLVGEQRQTPG